jgi:hypothetical protein
MSAATAAHLPRLLFAFLLRMYLPTASVSQPVAAFRRFMYVIGRP